MASDLRIAYADPADPAYFHTEGLSTVDSLAALFSVVPEEGDCSTTCTSVAENRFGADATDPPIGLNCSDENQGWFDVSATAENARIGGVDADLSFNSCNAWLGAMGDRDFSQGITEKTWARYYTGVVADDQILVFVR